MRSIIDRYNTFFSKENSIDFAILLFFLVMTGTLEVVGVAFIMPFFAVMMDPSIVQTNRYMLQLHEFIGAKSITEFMILFGGMIVVLLAISSALSMYTTWRMQRALWRAHDSISERLIKRYLSQPYETLANKDLSVYSRDILHGMEVFITQFLAPIGIVVSRGFVVVVIFGLIAYTDIYMAAATIVVFGGLYITIYYVARKRLSALGSVWEKASKARYHFAAEIFKSIKEIKIINPKLDIIDLYLDDTKKFSRMMEQSLFLSSAPRGIVETVGLSSSIIIVIFLLLRGGELSTIIPSLILFAVGGFRILPSLQMVYGAIAIARIHYPVFMRLSDDLLTLDPVSAPPAASNGAPAVALTDRLELTNITYRYPGAEKPSIDAVNATFEAGKVTALIGRSGAGKSTLMDIILGLLPPQAGTITIDGRALTEEWADDWRRHVGYVPQHAMILNASVAANIAFCAAGEMDAEKIQAASRLAKVDSFIATLPGGYDTVIGDTGMRLSGGQRQRLIIARALYRDPAILLMDEPTSSLDAETQAAFLDSINELREKKTIVIISHSAKVAKAADKCIMIDLGKNVAEGTPHDIMAGNPLAHRLLSH